MRAFVTGASGFLGRHLLPELSARGYSIRALYRRKDQARATREAGHEAVLGDVTEAGALAPHLADVTHVFHLAAALSGGARLYDRVNHRATADLARTCREAAPLLQRFVFVSSRGAVGPSRDGRPLTGRSPPRPVYDYGVAKLRAERDLAAVEGLPWAVVRPPLLYGPGDRLTLPLFRLAARGFFPWFSGGYRAQSMLHVRDAARATALAGTATGAAGRRVLLTGPEPVTPASLRDALAAAAGRRLREIHVPVALLLAVAETLSPFRGRDFLMELGYRRGDADPREARDLLGFHAAIDLADGVREAMEAYRASGVKSPRWW